MSPLQIEELNEKIKLLTPSEVISFFYGMYGNRIALSTSLGAEDQVLTQMASESTPNLRVFTLDTGRLFPETYELIARTASKYKLNIEVFFPSNDSVEKMVHTHGINLFYDSVENRKLCCGVRKIEPLRRAFSTLDAWICGLRASQSVTRSGLEVVEWDEANGLLKINPLATWSNDDVWNYIRQYNVLYNPLHDKGFPSIGCQPCTRGVEPGEDVRAGRWWWENPETKECGLHKREK
jgi:phosphoadenosine phosphosulfate reductase